MNQPWIYMYSPSWSGMFWENSIETGILSRVKQITSPGWMHEIYIYIFLNARSLEKSYDKPRQCTIKQRHYFVNKGLHSQSYSFSHTCMWELDYRESWSPKNLCFWTVVLEKTLESRLNCKEIKLVHPKDQSSVFIGRNDAEPETPILWPPDAKNWLIGKDPDAGKE